MLTLNKLTEGRCFSAFKFHFVFYNFHILSLINTSGPEDAIVKLLEVVVDVVAGAELCLSCTRPGTVTVSSPSAIADAPAFHGGKAFLQVADHILIHVGCSLGTCPGRCERPYRPEEKPTIEGPAQRRPDIKPSP